MALAGREERACQNSVCDPIHAPFPTEVECKMASFTRLRISSPTARSWFSVAKFSRFSVAVEAFLKRHRPHGSVREVLIAVAGPVVGNRCVLTPGTNRHNRAVRRNSASQMFIS